jgi:hypothetical protein
MEKPHIHFSLFYILPVAVHEILRERDGYQNLLTTYHWTDGFFIPKVQRTIDSSAYKTLCVTTPNSDIHIFNIFDL